MFVKVCGIRDAETLEAAVELGYDAVGFVCHPASVRYIEPGRARELAKRAGGSTRTVAVGMKYDEVSCLKDEVDFLQIYEPVDWPDLILAGSEPPVTGNFRYFLYDASRGSGEFHEPPEWTLELRDRLILAGGLKFENVARLAGKVQPFGLDVSSGVERERGVKDTGLMRRFIQEARNGTG
jgi:phosphoribosylanthranilate isomerase